MPLRISFGHHRLVCSNGLMIFVTTVDLLEFHLKGRLDQDKVNSTIARGLMSPQERSRAFQALHATRVPKGFTESLIATITELWGGREAEAISAALAGGVYRRAQISGVTSLIETVWHVYNALIWTAGLSRDLARQVAMTEVVHRTFMEALKAHGISLN